MFRSVCIFVAPLLVLFVTTAAQSQEEYRFAYFELPPLGGDHSFGWGLNEAGDVVGSAFLPGNVFHATIWIDEVPFDLGTLGHSDSRAEGTNSMGWTIGWSGITGQRAFLWRDGRMEDIGTLGGDTAEALGMNEKGDIVGQSKIEPGGNINRAFLWRDGVMLDLGGFHADRGSAASAINERGQVVGTAFKQIGQFFSSRAALWDNGQIIDLGTHRSDGGGASRGRHINDLGHIVGWGDDETNRDKAFIWFEGRMYNIHTLSFYSQSGAYAINNLGQVVGVHSTDEGLARGFLWEQGRGMQLLTGLIPPKCRWRPVSAHGINDAGQIAGYGTPKAAPDTIYRAFLMSPVHPALEMAPPSPGRAGEPNRLQVANCTPGARVTFLYSRFGGGTRIPGCDLQQNALQLDSPTVIGTAIADQSGVATITRTVPPVARGQTILFQAVIQNECAISQLVVHRFE